MKKTLYIDMDNVLVDFPSGIQCLDEKIKKDYADNYDNVPGIFARMRPLPGAVEAFNRLSERYEVYILSTAPWDNPTAWSDKLEWIKQYLGDKAYKRLILTHRKDLNKGHYLIDDRDKNGAAAFQGELIPFGSEKFRDWEAVKEYLL